MPYYRLLLFTFHYATTSMISVAVSVAGIPDLHSTMLLLKCLVKWLLIRLWGIYIPLCHYLNAKAEIIGGAQIYLHSTMLLLKYYRCSSCYYSYSIYIPLCYYLNVALRGCMCIPSHIYIPLCYYLNRSTTSTFPMHSIFTFHYATT